MNDKVKCIKKERSDYEMSIGRKYQVISESKEDLVIIGNSGAIIKRPTQNFETQKVQKSIKRTPRKYTKGDTGKRYSPEQQTEIIKFVRGFGRGGISAASRKYGVSYIALRRWLNKGDNKEHPKQPISKNDWAVKKNITKILTAIKSYNRTVEKAGKKLERKMRLIRKLIK